MLKKPSNYDEITVNLEFTPIELGGHIGFIKSIEEYTNKETGNTSLKVVTDTHKNDRQPNYFTEMFNNDDRKERKYSNSAIKYVSLKDDENCVKMLKGFITSVENSNPGFAYNWDKEVNQLDGKMIGLVFALEEYEKQDGTVGKIAKLNQFRSTEKVLDVKIPKVKLLDGTFIDYEQYNTKKEENKSNPFENFKDEVIIDDNLLD